MTKKPDPKPAIRQTPAVRSKAKQASKPLARQRKILDAAILAYARSGVAQASFTQVAELAGVPRPLVNYYFPTSEALQEAVIGAVLERLKEAALFGIQENWDDPVRALVGYSESYFKWGVKNRDLVTIWIYFYYLASYSQSFRAMSDSSRQTGRERIASLIYRGVETGAFVVPKGLSVPVLALNVQGLLTGNFVMAFSESSLDPLQIARQTSAAVLALLRPRK